MGTSAADIIKRLSFSSVSPSSVRSSTMSASGMLATSLLSASTLIGPSATTTTLSSSAVINANAVSNNVSNSNSEVPSTSTKVQVCLRIKPCDSKVETIKILDETKVRAIPPPTALPTSKTTEYSFSRVFGPETVQQDVFEQVAGGLVTSLLENGKDGLIFAYGVTNSGKTFTVEGTKQSPGIIPLTLKRIFATSPQAIVYVSYLQIYNDQVHDLQEAIPVSTPSEPIPPLRKNLKVKLREDQVIVEGLKETRVTSLNEGQSKLHIVDLAGSERGKRTKATGVRQVEASNINLSLSQLMQCLDAMRANQKLARLYPDKPRDKPPFRPIPFRDCKLTMLFRDCLRGKNCGGVVMIVNASPDPVDFEETCQALRYGEMTRSTAIEPNMAASNLLSMAAAVAGASKYDYNGRLIRAALDGAAQHQSAVVKFAPTEVEEERVIRRNGENEDENDEQNKKEASNNARRLSSPLVPQQPGVLRSALKVAQVVSQFASPSAINMMRTSNNGKLMRVGTPKLEGVDPLVEENDTLRRELAEARAQIVTMEIQIRDELALEMGERLKEMESRYNARLARAQNLGEERTEVLQMSLKKQQQYSNPAMEDLRILADQVTECEEEMERMREKHKRDIEALQTELNNARRANIEASMQHSVHQQQAKQVPSTPWMVAEERKRVDRLLRDLEDEKEAHRQVILERAELQDALDRATAGQRLFHDKEEMMGREIRVLKEQLDTARNTIVIQEKQLQQWKTKVGSPQQCSAQLSGVAPNLLLSKRRNKENENNMVLRSKENYEPLHNFG